MGKECAYVMRTPSRTKITRTRTSQQNIQSEVSKHWFSQKEAISQFNVTEDGHVVVIIRSVTSAIKVTCAGLSNKGNDYKELLQLLISKSLLKSHKHIKAITVKRNQEWSVVNPSKDTFQSSDVINICLYNKFSGVRKAIRK